MNSHEREPTSSLNESSMEKKEISPEEDYYRWNMEELLDANPDVEDKPALLEKFWRDRAVLFEGAEQDFDYFLIELRNRKHDSNAQLASFNAQGILRIRQENFTAEEFEQRMRDYGVEVRKQTPLTDNKVLCYSIKENEVELHIGPAMTLKRGELLKTIREGFNNLAQRFKSDPTLRDTNKVTVYSKLVKEKPNLFEQFGFTLNPESPDSKNRKGSISKEKFVAQVDKRKRDVK